MVRATMVTILVVHSIPQIRAKDVLLLAVLVKNSLLVQHKQIERVQVVLQDQLTKIPIHMAVLLV